MQRQIILKQWLVEFDLKVKVAILRIFNFAHCVMRVQCASTIVTSTLWKKTQKYTKKHTFQIVSIWQKDNSKSHLSNYWNYPFKWFHFEEKMSFLWKIFKLRNVFHEIAIRQRIWYLKKATISMLECTIRMLPVVSMDTTCYQEAFQTKTSIAYWPRKTKIMKKP